MTTKKENNSTGNADFRDGGHDFDGIKELDNDLPRWWVNLFFVTIAFGLGYMAWYHLPGTPAQSPEAEYSAELKRYQTSSSTRLESGASGPSTGAGSFDFKAAQNDQAILAEGRNVFEGNCAACHGAHGEGLVGSNLTDDFWIHGKTSAKLLEVILKGVSDKGMPAWEDILGLKKTQAVLAYIASLGGSKPENAKEAQGEEGPIAW